MKKIQFIFVLFFLLISGQRAQAENGIIWEKVFLPYKLLNAVFSPDDKYIYATCTDIYYVIKYDLEGNILDTIKNVGGIRKFSDDGKYFWNEAADKYEYTSLSKVVPFGGGNYKILSWNWDINEKSDIGVAHGNTIRATSQDSNLILFKLSTGELLKYTSHQDKTFQFEKMGIHPNGKENSFIVSRTKFNGKDYYTDAVKLEIWSIPELKKIREIGITIPTALDSRFLRLRYSPDGSVLGYQHDGKLTLYSTTDYSVVWESEIPYIRNFNWSSNMEFLAFSTGTDGIYKMQFGKNEIKYRYPNMNGSLYIHFNDANSKILCSHNEGWVCLLDNTVTSITDPFFTTDYKTTLIQNQTNGNYQLQIEALQPNILTYSISDINGNIIQPNITQNLEQGTNQIDLETTIFPSGTYFINIEIASHTTTIKFMLVR